MYGRLMSCRTCWDRALAPNREPTSSMPGRSQRKGDRHTDNSDLWKKTTATRLGNLQGRENNWCGKKGGRDEQQNRDRCRYWQYHSAPWWSVSLSGAKSIPNLFLSLKPLWNLSPNDPSVLPDLLLSPGDRLLSALRKCLFSHLSLPIQLRNYKLLMTWRYFYPPLQTTNTTSD